MTWVVNFLQANWPPRTGETPEGLEPGKRFPPVVAQGKFVRGQEYLRSAEVAEGSRCQARWGNESCDVSFWILDY